jgi:hypothetical protein
LAVRSKSDEGSGESDESKAKHRPHPALKEVKDRAVWVGIAIVERFGHHGHEDSMHDRHLDEDGDEKHRENLCHSGKVGRVEFERNQTEKCSGEESQQRPSQVEPDAIVERAEESLLKVTNSLKWPFFFLCFSEFFIFLRHGSQSWRVFRSAVGRANRHPRDRAARVGRGNRPLGWCGADWRTGHSAD